MNKLINQKKRLFYNIIKFLYEIKLMKLFFG